MAIREGIEHVFALDLIETEHIWVLLLQEINDTGRTIRPAFKMFYVPRCESECLRHYCPLLSTCCCSDLLLYLLL